MYVVTMDLEKQATQDPMACIVLQQDESDKVAHMTLSLNGPDDKSAARRATLDAKTSATKFVYLPLNTAHGHWGLNFMVSDSHFGCAPSVTIKKPAKEINRNAKESRIEQAKWACGRYWRIWNGIAKQNGDKAVGRLALLTVG